MTFSPTRNALAACAVAALGLAAARPAAAVEAYAATGFPYALVGVAQPLGPLFAVRADFGTIAHHGYTGSTSDNDFKGADCDALSFAAAFTADPVLVGDARKAPKSACADPDDPAYAAFFDCAQ